MGLSSLAFSLLLVAADAGPDPAPPSRFRVAPRPAGAAALLDVDARPLATARAELGRGRARAALDRLKDVADGPLADRAALIAGDALLALGQPEASLAAYARAVESAQTSAVRIDGARGVIETLDLLKRSRDRLAWIEALRAVERRSPDLRLAHAETLIALERWDAADGLLRRLLVELPRSPLAEVAADLRAKIPTEQRTAFDRGDLVARFRNELAAGAAAAARGTLERIDGLGERERQLLEWEWARAAGGRAREAEVIDGLLKADPDGARSDELWLRKGRIALSADEADAAVVAFDEVVTRFPRSNEAAEAAFLAGWTRYDDGAYVDAEKRMRAFTDRFPRSAKVTEAWWYAGWSAYLDGRDDAARAAWASLNRAHPTSDLVPFAHYWTGRSFERNGAQDEAVEAYRQASSAAPLSYYAFWARTRLEAMGETIERPEPPGPMAPFDLRQILVDLGPRRPVSVDRAVALHAAGLDDDVDDEVRTLLRELPSPASLRQLVLRVDLLHGLGAHARAFRYAYAHRPPAAGVMKGEYWPWRVHRLVHPEAYASSVKEAAAEHGVDPMLVWSIMRSESHYREDALSPVGARGLMQLMPATARRIGRMKAAARPHSARFVEPESNVWLGTWYLAQLAERYRGFRPAQIGAYNAGPTPMERWLDELDGRPTDEFIERISYRETRRYTRRVLETLWTYELLYGQPRTELNPTVSRKPPPEDAVAF
jgi:tetratricopeptide (TPR) repeat protein